MRKKIKFSVLMSVYMNENPIYLNEALESVFKQTYIPNEVILIEDGPVTDKLEEIIIRYKKKYKHILKVIKYKENRGLGDSLRDGILNCNNEIIFRMDTDDVALSERFEKQIKVFLEKNVDIVGSNITEFDEKMQKSISDRIVPESDLEIKKSIKKRNPMNHMTVAFKRSAVIKAGNYEKMNCFEDYYLWAKMVANDNKFYNIQETLVNVRGGSNMIRRRGGLKYIKAIINFEKSLLNIKLINRRQYVINIMERIIISLIPNKLRLLFYKIFLRK